LTSYMRDWMGMLIGVGGVMAVVGVFRQDEADVECLWMGFWPGNRMIERVAMTVM